jgi:hypothetical protein
MIDTFIGALSQQIMASVTDQDSALIVQLAEVDETPDKTVRTYSDPVDIASSIFGFAAEKQVVAGNLLDTLSKLREVVKESSSSFPNVCLSPSWASLSGRTLAKVLT